MKLKYEQETELSASKARVRIRVLENQLDALKADVDKKNKESAKVFFVHIIYCALFTGMIELLANSYFDSLLSRVSGHVALETTNPTKKILDNVLVVMTIVKVAGKAA